MGSLGLSSARMGQTPVLLSFLLLVVAVQGSIFGHHRQRNNPAIQQEGREGKQFNVDAGGIDFTGCTTNPETGLCCIEETFEKQCQITFKKQAFNETVNKCYRPVEKVCNGQGEEVCQTVYESSCTTKYVEKQPGKFVGDTACEKLPVEICGAGCVFVEGDEECHEKVITSLVDVPEEVCDLNPQKLCKFVTKLVPSLSPKHECTIVPKETCHLKFTQPKQVPKPLQTRWCLDPTPAAPGESYDEADALGAPLGSR